MRGHVKDERVAQPLPKDADVMEENECHTYIPIRPYRLLLVTRSDIDIYENKIITLSLNLT